MLAAEDGETAATRALLAWYDSRRRDLPWRRRRDPYAIWISEVMLQQTRVDTVVPYYERFLARFPDAEALAAASEDEVLAAWSGLGYYRRARHLHAAARRIAAAGELPASAAAWRRLPGIGEYTAAAIASIALGEVVPVLDGNVERVVSRLTASRADPKQAAVRRELTTAVAELLDVARPGDSNQALMELGATVCLPREPLCDRCPLRMACAGRDAGDPERYPAPRARPATRRVRREVFVAQADGRFLLVRRSPEARLLAGFWELPWLEGASAAERPAALATKYGGVWEIGAALARVRHAITRRRFEIEVFEAAHRPAEEVAEPGAPSQAWYHAEEIGELATSSLVGKVLGAWERG